MPHLPPHIEVVRRIPSSDRFACYEGRRNGHQVFVKVANTNNSRLALAQEVIGLGMFRQIAQNTALPFKIPYLLDQGYGYIVTSWARGRSLSAGRLDEYDIKSLARIYAAIDRATIFRYPPRSVFYDGVLIGDYDERVAKMRKSDPCRILFRQALKRVREGQMQLVARLTHADLTPRNIIVDTVFGVRTYTAVDFESVNLNWPRFFDIVRAVTNRMVYGVADVAEMQQVVPLAFGYMREPLAEHDYDLNTMCLIEILSVFTHGNPDGRFIERACTIIACVLSGTPFYEVEVV